MPTPGRTTRAAIVAAARDLLETGGPSAVTMQAVAARVGVRAPSLYKRVRDRDALLSLVADAVVADLAVRLEASTGSFADLARAYRVFAHAQPEGFRLLFSGLSDPDAMVQAIAPVMRIADRVAGAEHALDAARLFTAWATGFLSMELAGAFRMGGDIDEAFEYGLDRLAAAFAPGQSVERPGQVRPAHGS